MRQGKLILILIILTLGFFILSTSEVNAPVDKTQIGTDDSQIDTRGPEKLGLKISPKSIQQGETLRVNIAGTKLNEIASLTFKGEDVGVFDYQDNPTALIGIDLRAPTGTYPLVLTLKDGTRVEEQVVIGKRYIAQAPLGIPEELGGNTPEAEQELISTLVEEGRLVSNIPTADTALWGNESFRAPVADPVVTDTYGYSRVTGSSNISHKGTDYRAPIGTPVYAMNDGKVAFTRFLRNYGHTVIIDHGLGLQTIYMHLSEILVEEGEVVERGKLIAKSGDTGYVFGPHLHLSIKIGGISIDPEQFLALFENEE